MPVQMGSSVAVLHGISKSAASNIISKFASGASTISLPNELPQPHMRAVDMAAIIHQASTKQWWTMAVSCAFRRGKRIPHNERKCSSGAQALERVNSLAKWLCALENKGMCHQSKSSSTQVGSTSSPPGRTIGQEPRGKGDRPMRYEGRRGHAPMQHRFGRGHCGRLVWRMKHQAQNIGANCSRIVKTATTFSVSCASTFVGSM